MTAGNDVTVWRIPLPDKAPGPETWALLDAGERARAERFIQDRDRHRFVAAHAGLRLALAAETGQPPRALRFQTIGRGKPILERKTVSFNLSHSGDLAVVAAWRGGDIGVDVETSGRLRDFDGLAGMVMTAQERVVFSGLPEDLRKAAFMRAWTRKEAVLKADGRGLMYDPRHVEVGLDDGAERSVLVDGRAWTLRDLDVGPGMAAAVCVDGPLGTIRQRSVIAHR